MRSDLENIELINYRCFKHLKLTFKERVNLLIGDNSSGKTTVIRALSSVLSSFFSGFSDDNTKFVGLSKNDFTIIESEIGLADELPVKVNFTNLGIEGALELHSKKGRTLKGPLRQMIEKGKTIKRSLFEVNSQHYPLPLFANFSTADIHSSRKLSKGPFIKYEHKPSFGYYECLQGDGLLPYWTKRLLVLKEANKGGIEIDGVTKALRKALGPEGCNVINDLQIRHNQSKVYYILVDGREIDTDNLSDGLLRLVNIVIDIAFRCLLLNKGIYGESAFELTEGTVLIDEIDLHLHPTLQSVVVKGLTNAFPKLQFIITSHAPMVMTGIPADDCNIIYKLAYSSSQDYTATEVELYGLDSTTILETVLDVVPRSKDVDDRLKVLFSFIDKEDYTRAFQKLKELQEDLGDKLPDLAKAEAMLNFLTGTDDHD